MNVYRVIYQIRKPTDAEGHVKTKWPLLHKGVVAVNEIKAVELVSGWLSPQDREKMKTVKVTYIGELK